MQLEGVRGFVFDVDGTLLARGRGGAHVLPGALDVLVAIRASGRPLALFTNASHTPPAALGARLRGDGLPVSDEELVTPVHCALSRLRGGPRVLLFARDDVRAWLAAGGVHVVDEGPADVVLVLHADAVDFAALDRAARALLAGARLLTGNYLPAYAGADGPVFSHGAMLTAALARASGARPVVVGKPSRAALRELRDRLGVPPADLLVTGDDARMDVALGRLGGARTVLVRSGISGALDIASLPERHRPHAVVGGVAELLPWL